MRNVKKKHNQDVSREERRKMTKKEKEREKENELV